MKYVLCLFMLVAANPWLQADELTVAATPSGVQAADGRFIHWVERRIDDQGLTGLPLRGADGFEVAKHWKIREFQDPHIVRDVKFAAALKAHDALGIIIENNDDIVLNGDTDEALHEPKQIAGSRKRVAFLHVHVIKEVRHVWL